MKKLILKIVPSSIKIKLINLFRNQIIKNETEISNNIPKTEIKEIHISDLEMILTREDLIKKIPKHGIYAEIGVDMGVFSKTIFEICVPKKLHLIDLWGSERYNERKKNLVEKQFMKEISQNSIEIHRGFSTEVVDSFDDNYFDFIYIDTDHSFEVTFKELKAYRSKVKENGIIAGHDYIIGNWNGLVRYGVIEAVYSFCSLYDWEIIYLTMEIDSPPSFAIRKIK